MNTLLLKITLIIALFFGIHHVSIGQDPMTMPGKAEATIELSYFKATDSGNSIVAIVKAKNKDGKFVPAVNTSINFYLSQENENQIISTLITDDGGKVILNLAKTIQLDNDRYFTILAKLENNTNYEDAEESVHYRIGILNLTLTAHDSVKVATAKLTEINKEGVEIPVEGAEVKFYIQRLFGFMPAAEENTVSTDANGEAAFNVPDQIPGDTLGTLTISARVEDNENFGNIEKRESAKWGKVLVLDKDPFPRSLYGSHAPISLILTFSILFSGVWFTYFFIVYQLRKIKTEGETV